MYDVKAPGLNLDKAIVRKKLVTKASIISIITNVLLASFKALVGLLSNSIAIVLDAVNNLSDALSGIITLVGTKLANKKPDREHPFGHGRGEYITAMAIAIIIFYAGLTSFVESVKKIISPDIPDYSIQSAIIVLVAIAVKILLSIYLTKVGKSVDSESLKNSGKDSLLDVFISLSTLVALLSYVFFKISIESYLGLLISIIIIKAGVTMLKDIISRLLGESINGDMAQSIKQTVMEYPDVKGVYDLVLFDFGPNEYRGSFHIEVMDTMNANDLDELLRDIQNKVFDRFHIILTAIGVYSVNTRDPFAIKAREDISKIVLSHEYIKQIHGFYLNEKNKTMRFDVIVSFDADDREKVYYHIVDEIKELYPDYKVTVTLDTDYMNS